MDNPAGCTALVLYAADDEDAADGPTASARGGGGGSMATPQANTETAVEGGGGVGAGGSVTPLSPPVPARFVGLSNQGATCYMNSLLQTLYMTPEVGSYGYVHTRVLLCMCAMFVWYVSLRTQGYECPWYHTAATVTRALVNTVALSLLCVTPGFALSDLYDFSVRSNGVSLYKLPTVG